MDTSPQIQLPQVPKKKNNLLFVEIGLFEIGFVAILLALIFGLLNFLNILNLNKALPLLSFLPRLNKSGSLNSAIPSPTPTPLPPFVTLQQSHEGSVLYSFIKGNLKEAYLPQLNNTNSTYITPRLTQVTWKASSLLANAYLASTASSTAMISFDITLPKQPLSQDTAQQTSQTYLLSYNDTSNWQCKTVKDSSLCENFNSRLDGKIGYGILNTTRSKSTEFFFCFIPSTNPHFSSVNSCLNL